MPCENFNDFIRSKLFREGNPFADFEKIFPGRIDQYASELAWLYSNLNEVINYDRELIPEAQLCSAFLMWRACNAIFGAIEIFGRGYPMESISLLRNVVEALCKNTHMWFLLRKLISY